VGVLVMQVLLILWALLCRLVEPWTSTHHHLLLALLVLRQASKGNAVAAAFAAVPGSAPTGAAVPGPAYIHLEVELAAVQA
jgi:hypothetical protein